MIMKYCTKRDINGNTYILEVDTDKRTFSKNPGGFFHRCDCIQITQRYYKELVTDLKNNNFTEV